jgi:hypothetical protein
MECLHERGVLRNERLAHYRDHSSGGRASSGSQAAGLKFPKIVARVTDSPSRGDLISQGTCIRHTGTQRCHACPLAS